MSNAEVVNSDVGFNASKEQVSAQATDESFAKFVDGFLEWAKTALDWMERNWGLTIFLVAALIFWRRQEGLTKVKLMRQKTEFEAARTARQALNSPSNGED